VSDDDRNRGRPRDPAVGEAALRETLALLDARGYAGLRVADVARNAGIGLGSLYRRWPTKYALVVAALRPMAAQRAFTPTGDPEADLVRGLMTICDSLGHRAAPLLSVLLSDPSSELAAAVREAKVDPARAANRERLRRVLGPVPDLDDRADTGPALIFMHMLVTGKPPAEPYIRAHILPRMLAGLAGSGAGRGGAGIA
jgi:AcrR family transcriptional regulator